MRLVSPLPINKLSLRPASGAHGSQYRLANYSVAEMLDYLMKYNLKEVAPLKREENETSTQGNKDRSDFTLMQRLTQSCRGERKRKGWVQNASKTENAELDVRECRESTPRYHQN